MLDQQRRAEAEALEREQQEEAQRQREQEETVRVAEQVNAHHCETRIWQVVCICTCTPDFEQGLPSSPEREEV